MDGGGGMGGGEGGNAGEEKTARNALLCSLHSMDDRVTGCFIIIILLRTRVCLRQAGPNKEKSHQEHGMDALPSLPTFL